MTVGKEVGKLNLVSQLSFVFVGIFKECDILFILDAIDVANQVSSQIRAIAEGVFWKVRTLANLLGYQIKEFVISKKPSSSFRLLLLRIF